MFSEDEWLGFFVSWTKESYVRDPDTKVGVFLVLVLNEKKL